jgi:hypothetical protein
VSGVSRISFYRHSEIRGTVSVRVDEWLYGTASGAESVVVPYREPPDHSSGDGPERIVLAWQNVKFSKNMPVMVALSGVPFLGASPGDPLLVSSDEREFGIIRSLTDQARRLETSPDLIYEAAASLSRSTDPALAGYLDAYVTYGTAAHQPDVASALRLQLLASPSVPPHSLSSIGTLLAADYERLSPGAQAMLVQRFNELIQRFTEQGQLSDGPAALAAHVGLARIARFDNSVAKVTDPLAGNKLASAYRALVKARTIYRTQLLDTEFGVRQR